MGEDNCAVHGGERHRTRHQDCSNDQWFGLYCAKYQRFFCAGKGNCGSIEEYMTQMNSFRQGQWRP